jgi:hypothetical protein
MHSDHVASLAQKENVAGGSAPNSSLRVSGGMSAEDAVVLSERVTEPGITPALTGDGSYLFSALSIVFLQVIYDNGGWRASLLGVRGPSPGIRRQGE